jgi:hypothetical protein
MRCGIGPSAERDRPEVRARENRRIHERRERRRGEGDPVGTLAQGRQRRSVLPAGGKPQTRGDHQIVRGGGLRIEEDLVPADHGELRRRGRPGGEPLRGGWREEVERDLKRPGAVGHVDAKGVHVRRVARPVERTAPGGHADPGHVGDRARRSVLAGQPLRVEERDRSGRERESHPGVEETPRSFPRVHFDRDRRRIREKRRRRTDEQRGARSTVASRDPCRFSSARSLL